MGTVLVRIQIQIFLEKSSTWQGFEPMTSVLLRTDTVWPTSVTTLVWGNEQTQGRCEVMFIEVNNNTRQKVRDMTTTKLDVGN